VFRSTSTLADLNPNPIPNINPNPNLNPKYIIILCVVSPGR